jgi:phasin family protein
MAVMETLKEKTGSITASAGELNRFAIDKVEEIARLNLASASYFSEVGIKQLRAMSGVRDLDSMRKFTADTISLSGEIAKRVLDDSKSWMNFGVDVKEKVTEVFSNKKEEAEVEVKKKPVAKVSG